MNQSLQPGGNTILTSFDGTVTVMHSISTNSDIDLTAFLLTDKNKVQGDSGIIFYNQPKGQNGVATYFPAQDNQSIRTHRIDFDLSKMPQGISRIAVTLTEAGNSSFGNVENLKAMVQSGDIVYELNPAQLSIEKGIVVLEIYLRGKEPKLRSSWQGFSSGLDGLCEHFGVEVSDEPADIPPKLDSNTNNPSNFESVMETVDQTASKTENGHRSLHTMLVECKACGEQVAESALSCPKCGVPNPAGRTSSVLIFRKKTLNCAVWLVNIFIDDEFYGSLKNGGELTIELTPGKHKLEALAAGVITPDILITNSFEISGGQMLEYECGFKTMSGFYLKWL